MTTGINRRGTTEYLVRNPHSNSTARIAVSFGRQLQTLELLLQQGATGCTFFQHPDRRWAVYVHRLVALGFNIRIIKERHGGVYPGYHARYILVSDVTHLSDEVPA